MLKKNIVQCMGAGLGMLTVNSFVFFLTNALILHWRTLTVIAFILCITLFSFIVIFKADADRQKEKLEGPEREGGGKVFIVFALIILADFLIACFSAIGKGFEGVLQSPWLLFDWFLLLVMLNGWIFRFWMGHSSE